MGPPHRLTGRVHDALISTVPEFAQDPAATVNVEPSWDQTLMNVMVRIAMPPDSRRRHALTTTIERVTAGELKGFAHLVWIDWQK
jgi:hypothetical protein